MIKSTSSKRASVFFTPILLVAAASTHADFVSPFEVTPPAPGLYSVFGGTSKELGAWSCVPFAGAVSVDTSKAPLDVVLGTGTVHRGVNGVFFTHTAEAGVVSFSYTISGIGDGTFGW